MNIDDIIIMIESRHDKIDRAIGYAELIMYLNDLKKAVRFENNPSNWKNAINDSIVELVNTNLDKSLVIAKEAYSSNLI